MRSDSSTKGLEQSGSQLSGDRDGPARVPIVNAIDGIVKVLEVVGVRKESRNEMDFVVSSELVDELGLPTIRGRTSAESASVSGKGRREDITIVLQLVWMVGVSSDVVAKCSSILGRGTGHHAIIPTRVNNGRPEGKEMEMFKLTSCRRK